MLYSLSLSLSLSLFAPIAQASVSNDQVQSQHIREADGTSGQNTNSGAGVKTGHIQDAAVTSAKIANGAVTDAKITGPISTSKITQGSGSGLNADLLDGKDSSLFAPAVHTHAQSDVTGLPGALAGKADVGHNHDAIYQKKYARVVTVSLNGDGDFTSLANAMNAITDAGPLNPYLVKIMPGVYDIGTDTVQMKQFVDIEGSGREITKLTGTATVIVGVANAALRDLSVEAPDYAVINPCLIENVSVSGGCIYLHSVSWSVTIRNVSVTGSWLGVWANVPAQEELILENITTSTHSMGIEVGSAGKVVIRDVRINSDNEYGMTIGGPDISVHNAVIRSTASSGWAGGLIVGSENSIVLRGLDISFSTGYGILAQSNSPGKIEISDSRVIATGAGGTPGIRFDLNQIGILNNVYVNTADVGTGPALELAGNSSVKSFNSRYLGDASIQTTTASLSAANSQFSGSLSSQGTLKLLNCFDGNFVALPNQ